MTDKLFFDTDCLSSFLWVGREDIVLFRYKHGIVIPQYVYEEFCRPGVAHLRQKLDGMIRAGLIIKMEIVSGTAEAKLFRKLTKQPQVGHMIIGRSESALSQPPRFCSKHLQMT